MMYSELIQKRCTKCGLVKPNKEFYRARDSWCKKCSIIQSGEYQRPNKSALWGFKSSQQRKDIQRRYREKHRENIRAIQRLYVKNNSAKVLARTRKYQCQKLMSTPKWLTKTHWKEIESFYLEAFRMRTETKVIYEVDHIVPLQGQTVSGLHVPWNLQIIERSANRAKANRLKD